MNKKAVLTFNYPCSSLSVCYPYQVELFPGVYRFEAWGAQGSSASSKYEGGRGGYTAGTIRLVNQTKLYIFVGITGHSYSGDVEDLFNGGGKRKYSGEAVVPPIFG